MGLVNTQLFVGTRCRLSRHRDAKFVNGWVRLFIGQSLVVTTESHLESEPGDEFYFEAFGSKVKACAPVVLRLVENGDGSEAKLTLQLKGHLQIVDHTESGRIMVQGMAADLTAAGSAHKAHVRDVSAKGLGIETEAELAKGAEIDLTIDTALGPVHARGVVRHVRKRGETYRVGVELTNLSRLDGSRWKKLFGAAA